MKLLNFMCAITKGELENVVKPIKDIINVLIPVLLGLVVSVGLIYCIILGVKYAKAQDPQEHEKAKSALINAIVGFVLIFVLLAILTLGEDVFISFWQSYVAG